MDKNRNVTTARMSDGTQAGLQTRESLQRDISLQKRAQAETLSSLEPDLTGRDAQTVYRDVKGRKVDVGAQRAEELEWRRKWESERDKKREWGL